MNGSDLFQFPFGVVQPVSVDQTKYVFAVSDSRTNEGV
jgi:hypothetical protein